jgi:hypothetical protein
VPIATSVTECSEAVNCLCKSIQHLMYCLRRAG